MGKVAAFLRQKQLEVESETEKTIDPEIIGDLNKLPKIPPIPNEEKYQV